MFRPKLLRVIMAFVLISVSLVESPTPRAATAAPPEDDGGGVGAAMLRLCPKIT